MDSLNLSVSEEDVNGEGGDGGGGEAERSGGGAERGVRTGTRREGPRLLYYFMQLFQLLGGNVCLTTYMERGRSEYFAGFTNAYLVDAPVLDSGRPIERYRWVSLSLVFRASRSLTF